MFLMYFQECHYCQSDLVVIEFTGCGPCYRRLLKSSAKASDFGKSSSARAMAGKFYYHQVLLTVMYHCLKTLLFLLFSQGSAMLSSINDKITDVTDLSKGRSTKAQCIL